jgi:hypothetical protein
VRFKGVKIDLFATVASHHGTGMASINGGPESKVNYKAAQRAEQVFVWGSPILPNREHVLRVRLAGDGVVTADRFDVSVSDQPDVALASIKEVSFNRLIVEMEDMGASVVEQGTVQLLLDGAPVPSTVFKSGAITTITFSPSNPFLPGAQHILRVEARDKAGSNLSSELAFNLPSPFFPLTGLGGPVSSAGNWGLRQIWDAGRADAVVSAVEIALRAQQAGFGGRIHDVQVPYLDFALSSNPGSGGIFFENLPLPAEGAGLSPSDFVVVARAKVRIPRRGDWTIGVHSDDGFALRFTGAPFASVHGNGVRNDDFPEYMAHLTETGDSNTRGILRNVAAGEYEIECIIFQRVGTSHFEIYAAEGAFEEDLETDQWQLIGAPGGLEILAGPKAKLTALGLSWQNGRVTVDFISPEPDLQHQLQESIDLKAWQPVSTAAFEKRPDGVIRSVLPNATGAARFYRIVLP